MRDADTVHASSSDRGCAAGDPLFVVEAERQLAAFHQAVLSLHGAEQAWEAAEDWLRELETAAHDAPAPWRRISLSAAERLATRLASSEHTPSCENRWRQIQRRTEQLLCARPCEAQ